MKAYAIHTIFILFFLAIVTEGSTLRVGTRKLLIADSCYFTGCIEVKRGILEPGASLILGDCTNQEYGFEEHFVDDTSVRFRSRLDRKYCMQATHSPMLRAGGKLRLYPCSRDNQAQLFTRSTQPVKDPSLCVGYRGRQANVNIDPIILKKCKPGQDIGWSYD